MKIYRSVLFILILFIISACGSKEIRYEKVIVKQKTVKTIEPVKKIEKFKPKPAVKKKPSKKIVVTISGVGDIMLGTNFPKEPNYLPPDDGKKLLVDVKPFFKGSDIVFGNLEGPLLDGGTNFKNCKKCFSFKVPEHYVKHLVDAGFNLLSLANNHSGDFGPIGRDKTSEILTRNKIEYAGTIKQPYKTFTKNGIKYGFSAFAPNYGTPDLREIEKACAIVKELSKVSDIVIVSFHGGAEGADNRNVTRKDEIFYGESRGNVYDFSHKVIDAGADVVFGHGPHITRAVELYKGRFIAYSLGNFCTYARFNLLGLNGIAPLITLKTDKNGKFLSGKIISLIQPFKKGPVQDKASGAINEIIELTQKDFPLTCLDIKKDGTIILKPKKSAENLKEK